MLELSDLAQHSIVIVVTLGLMGLLLIEKIKPAYIFFSAVLIFLLTGIISTDDFLDALSNESILSIFLLIFITYGVRTNFNILGWMDKLFGGAKTGRGFILRMSSSVSIFSSFLNNTPIVALFLPYVYQWSKKRDIPSSKLLIPLSYAAMAGGMITVIGTSTNLILKGLVESKGETAPGFLDYLLPGLIITAATVFYLVTIGYSILPKKEDLLKNASKKQRKYLVEVDLTKESDLIGKTIKEAELDALEDIELFEIVRYGTRISPVPDFEYIRAKDSLVFVGDSKKIVEFLERNDNFSIPEIEGEDQEKINEINKAFPGRSKDEQEDRETQERNILEIVIPTNSALIGRTLKSYRFRQRFNAVVLGIHRNGEILNRPIEEIVLQPGDLLLLIPGAGFEEVQGRDDDLYVVSVVKKIKDVSSWAKKGFLGVLGAVILGLVFADLSLFFALILVISYMLAAKMISIENLKNQFSVNLFIVLASSLAFSTALINSGVAEIAAGGFMQFFESFGDRGIIIGIYLVTLVVGSFVTHAAAVAIVFPIAFSIGSQVSGLDMTAVFISIAFAASASFHTPFSYQTNMMVYGPGGYKFTDFIKAGMPLTLLYSVLFLIFVLFYYQI